MQTQPIPNVTADDVERIVRRDFPPDRIGEALAILGEFISENPYRVRLAALKLAAGKIERLRYEVDRANYDYRDVLVAAEYPGYWKQVPTSPAEEQRIIDADWKQYEDWLNR
jgi:hypothetical protein